MIIQLEVIEDDPDRVILKNEVGDSFTYNPRVHHGLHDFLYNAKVIGGETLAEWMNKRIQENESKGIYNKYS